MQKCCLFLTIIFITAGCLQTENSSNGDATVSGSVNFVAANNVLNNNCADCHDYAELTEEKLIENGDVIPGDAFNSPIYYRLRGSDAPTGDKNMPQSSTLTPEEVLLIFTWIQNITP